MESCITGPGGTYHRFAVLIARGLDTLDWGVPIRVGTFMDITHISHGTPKTFESTVNYNG